MGNQVRFWGQPFATYVQSETQLSIDFGSTATQQSVEALEAAFGYSSLSDGPSNHPRRVEMTFGLGTAATRDVRSFQLTIRPPLASATMSTIDEDSPTPHRQEIVLVLTGSVSTQILVQASPVSQSLAMLPIRQVKGLGSNSSKLWIDMDRVGLVNDNESSLLVSALDWLGFKPAKDFFWHSYTAASSRFG